MHMADMHAGGAAAADAKSSSTDETKSAAAASESASAAASSPASSAEVYACYLCSADDDTDSSGKPLAKKKRRGAPVVSAPASAAEAGSGSAGAVGDGSRRPRLFRSASDLAQHRAARHESALPLTHSAIADAPVGQTASIPLPASSAASASASTSVGDSMDLKKDAGVSKRVPLDSAAAVSDSKRVLDSKRDTRSDSASDAKSDSLGAAGGELLRSPAARVREESEGGDSKVGAEETKQLPEQKRQQLPFHCEVCDVSFATKEELQMHRCVLHRLARLTA
jgi:hypothetical protein